MQLVKLTVNIWRLQKQDELQSYKIVMLSGLREEVINKNSKAFFLEFLFTNAT